ncbi:MAG TPA: DUF6263 family protein [Niabella sp.]|jgi:hypothetical protein|nr:DUF6263 family protein [Chitinophagaceae bacterium]HRN46875.1 DUF6263 family protein [Niabella sp.]HRO84618.1 DUF6263 family protein [Niabella sp.]HUN04108.1 DUF6263 family protein [Niabella sp.]
MRKKLFLLFVPLLLIMALQAQSYKLSFNPGNNDKFDMKSEVKIKIVQSMMGQEMEINMNSNIDNLYEITNGSGENKEVKIKYNKLKTGMEMMGQTITMDSDSPDKDDPKNKIYNMLKESEITALVKPNGDIVELKGVDELAKKFENFSEAELQGVKNYIEKDAIKSSFEQSFKWYPEKEVKVGDAWTTVTTISSPYELKSNNNYTLIKVENNVGYLTVKSDVTTDGSKKMQSNGMELEINLTGKNEGEMQVDMKSGMPVSSNIVQNLSGKMEIMGQEVPISISNTIKTNTTKL